MVKGDSVAEIVGRLHEELFERDQPRSDGRS